MQTSFHAPCMYLRSLMHVDCMHLSSQKGGRTHQIQLLPFMSII
jgi:hypothetical protein